MPRISLTDFVDISAASGTSKAAAVRRVKNRPDYHPAFDYYRQIRHGIVATHRAGASKSRLDHHIGAVTDAKKVDSYNTIKAAYKKWWGRKGFTWFNPPANVYLAHGFEVSVNPELGLEYGGNLYLIKLYFKADKLTKSRTDVITHLMSDTLSGLCPPTTTMSVLDIRQSKLITPTVPIAGLGAILGAELAYIAAIWPSL